VNDNFEKFWQDFLANFGHPIDYCLSEEAVKEIAQNAFEAGYNIIPKFLGKLAPITMKNKSPLLNNEPIIQDITPKVSC